MLYIPLLRGMLLHHIMLQVVRIVGQMVGGFYAFPIMAKLLPSYAVSSMGGPTLAADASTGQGMAWEFGSTFALILVVYIAATQVPILQFLALLFLFILLIDTFCSLIFFLAVFFCNSILLLCVCSELCNQYVPLQSLLFFMVVGWMGGGGLDAGLPSLAPPPYHGTWYAVNFS